MRISTYFILTPLILLPTYPLTIALTDPAYGWTRSLAFLDVWMVLGPLTAILALIGISTNLRGHPRIWLSVYFLLPWISVVGMLLHEFFLAMAVLILIGQFWINIPVCIWAYRRARRSAIAAKTPDVVRSYPAWSALAGQAQQKARSTRFELLLSYS